MNIFHMHCIHTWIIYRPICSFSFLWYKRVNRPENSCNKQWFLDCIYSKMYHPAYMVRWSESVDHSYHLECKNMGGKWTQINSFSITWYKILLWHKAIKNSSNFYYFINSFENYILPFLCKGTLSTYTVCQIGIYRLNEEHNHYL